jgi:pilus assembly protein CpaB
MKPKTMILMVVAVGCGLGASYMTSRLLAERSNAPEEQEKIVILVARKTLDTGTTIKEPRDMFTEKAVLKDEEPKNSVSKFEELKGRVLKHTLREGDFVSSADLLSDKESFIAYILPKGYRAMGLRCTIEGIAAGFASLPLSRVDILSTVRRGDDKQSYSKVLLQNVLVLAADQEMHRPDDKNAMLATVVTVALTPEETLKVALAKEYGPLTLVLRKFNDNQKVEADKMTMETMIRGGSKTDAEERSDTPPAPKKEPPKVVVEKPKVEPPAKVVAKTHTHVMTILNAERQEQWEFTLDENDEVVGQRLLPRDTPRSETPGAPAAAPSLTNPPPPTATPPAGGQPTTPPQGDPRNPAG